MPSALQPTPKYSAHRMAGASTVNPATLARASMDRARGTWSAARSKSCSA